MSLFWFNEMILKGDKTDEAFKNCGLISPCFCTTSYDILSLCKKTEHQLHTPHVIGIDSVSISHRTPSSLSLPVITQFPGKRTTPPRASTPPTKRWQKWPLKRYHIQGRGLGQASKRIPSRKHASTPSTQSSLAGEFNPASLFVVVLWFFLGVRGAILVRFHKYLVKNERSKK